MSKFQDPIYLASDQYRDAGNLNARIHLHERYSTNPRGWFHWVFDQIELIPSAEVLEVGCGSGQFWSENLERIPNKWKVTLSDFSQGMVVGSFAKFPHERNQFKSVVSNAMAIPFPNAFFDTVIANHMLYHVPDRQRAIAEIARVLKPEGTLYAATNGENHLLELVEIIEQKYRPAKGLLPGRPSREFSLENGAAQLAPCFGRVVRRDYQDALMVTEAAPLLAYLHSMVPITEYMSAQSSKDQIEMYIDEEIKQTGCIRIQKSCGLFIGKK